MLKQSKLYFNSRTISLTLLWFQKKNNNYSFFGIFWNKTWNLTIDAKKQGKTWNFKQNTQKNLKTLT